GIEGQSDRVARGELDGRVVADLERAVRGPRGPIRSRVGRPGAHESEDRGTAESQTPPPFAKWRPHFAIARDHPSLAPSRSGRLRTIPVSTGEPPLRQARVEDGETLLGRWGLWLATGRGTEGTDPHPPSPARGRAVRRASASSRKRRRIRAR